MILVGCADSAEQVEEDIFTIDEAPRYQLGAPLTNPDLALVLASSSLTDTLTTREFEAQLQRIVNQFPSLADDEAQLKQIRRGIIEDYITRRLLGEEAERLGFEPDQTQIDEQFVTFQQQFPNEEAFREALAGGGFSEDSLRFTLKEELRLKMVQDHIVEGAEEPTEEEFAAFLQKQAEQVRAQHILFSTDTDQNEADVIRFARAVRDSARSGINFSELATRHGSDGTAQRGGDLGFFSRSDMVQPFAEAAFALADSGDVSPLVKTQFGYHIIRLTGRRTRTTIDTTQARTTLAQEQRMSLMADKLEALRSVVTVQVNTNVIGIDINEGA